MVYSSAAFIFRRDLRLEDNTGLHAALEQSEEVRPCFIFDPSQRKGDYFSQNAFQFMCESLMELDAALRRKGSRLCIYEGEPGAAAREIINDSGVEAVFCNRDYTPFSISRDGQIATACKETGVDFRQFADYLLCEPEQALQSGGRPYTIFTHFFRRASQIAVPLPEKNNRDNYSPAKSMGSAGLPPYRKNPSLFAHGGRKNGLKILSCIGSFRHYANLRNLPAREATTGLSAHHKFGTISIRESYWAIADRLSKNHQLISEIYWRDFFTHIAFHFPRVFGSPFNARYSRLKWSGNKKLFEAWKDGRTGFPIVDAGMRQLNRTGFMHNRVRMIVASFLTKDLHIDWREGEKYFASKLVDYDPSVNNGNWQWSASTGCDAQPYFRIFNPWLQQVRFDPDCAYVKKWLPELAGLSPGQIHSLGKPGAACPPAYPAPIVEHSSEAAIAKEMFRAPGKA